MTQTNQRQQTATNTVSTIQRNPSTEPSTSSRPTTDSISDNDTGEKPVREKLKKASLASMSGNIEGEQGSAINANEENSASTPMYRDSLLEKQTNKKGVEPRGRPVKKRSFDDPDTPEADGNETARENVAKLNANGHLRKRSRDVRVGETRMEDRRTVLAGTPVREESEDAAHGVETKETCISGPKSSLNSKSPATETLSPVEMEQDNQIQGITEPKHYDSGTLQQDEVAKAEQESADQEMRDSASSPRRKRSRDHFDTEADREQKIPATEEARAHRRSDELERDEGLIVSNRSPVSPEGSAVAANEPVTVEEESGSVNAHAEAERKERPSRTAFSSTSTLSPSIPFTRSDLSARLPSVATKTTDEDSHTSAKAFASSGFAALAGSSTSPFGTLGGSSTTATASPFASAEASNPGKTETGNQETQNKETATGGGTGAFVNSSSAGFGATDRSPFATSGSSKTGIFGGSVFGSAFGGPFGGGNRLTSFAAPTGNAKLGATNGAIKPIGSPKNDAGDDENSESDGDVSTDNRKEEETEEADGRFQHQDVETGEGGEESIFSSRASLYSFRDNTWKESGKGTFKLNIAAASPEDASSDRKTGRFIMRAHQTYRVLLNAPVFKQMQIGDGKGNEPSGKSFLFAVIENAKPVAHMVKLSDVTDSKFLYHEVQRLQRGLE